jgi:aromatic-amino-acid transaminase
VLLRPLRPADWAALYAVASDPEIWARHPSHDRWREPVFRAFYCMQTEPGSAAVRLLLRDPKLTTSWLDELEQMRTRIRQVRARLAEAGRIGSVDLAPLGQQNGMFATLPLDKAQIETLRDEHGIYMAGSGRINVAGLTTDNIGKFTAALAAVAAETV